MALLFFIFPDAAKAGQSMCTAEQDIENEMTKRKLLFAKTTPKHLSALQRGVGECKCKYYYSKNREKCADSANKKKGKAKKCHDQTQASGCQTVYNSGYQKCKWVPAPTPSPTPAPPTPEPTPPTPLPTPKPLEPNLEPPGCCTYKENPNAICKSGDGKRPFELTQMRAGQWSGHGPSHGRLENNYTRCATGVCNAWKWCKGYYVQMLSRDRGQSYPNFSSCRLVVDLDLWMQEVERDPDTFRDPSRHSQRGSAGLYEYAFQDPDTGMMIPFDAKKLLNPYSYGEGSLELREPHPAGGLFTCYQKK